MKTESFSMTFLIYPNYFSKNAEQSYETFFRDKNQLQKLFYQLQTIKIPPGPRAPHAHTSMNMRGQIFSQFCFRNITISSKYNAIIDAFRRKKLIISVNNKRLVSIHI